MSLWLNRVTIPVNAAGASGSVTATYDPNSGTPFSGTNFVPTAGRLLVLVHAGPVTATTPAGWTLPTGGSAVQNDAVYVFWKSAAGSDTATITHNGDGTYPTMVTFFEFAAGSTFSGSAANAATTDGSAGPSLSGLTGTNLIIGVACLATQSGANTWTWGSSAIDLVEYLLGLSGKGFCHSIAYIEDSAAASLTVSAARDGGAATTEERLLFAVKVSGSADPTYPPITLRAAGVTPATGALVTAINPAVPAGATTGDLSVLCVEAKPYTTTITTPTGWTKIGEATNGTVASAADVGSMKVAMFVRESAAAGAIGNLTLTGADSAMAVIHTYAKGSAYIWDFSAFTSGGDTVNDANYSATGGILPVAPEDWVVCATAVNTDLVVGFTGQAINGLTGATMTKNIRTTGATSTQGLTTTGNDSKLIVTDAEVTDGSSVTPPTFTYTSTSVNSGTSMWLRLRQTLPWWSPGKRTQQAIRRAANW